jgi:hypothetical protein
MAAWWRVTALSPAGRASGLLLWSRPGKKQKPVLVAEIVLDGWAWVQGELAPTADPSVCLLGTG